MKHTSLYSPEAPKGWMPWGLFAPIVCIVLAALSELSAYVVLRPFHVANAKGEPNGVAGFALFLLVTFTLMGLALVSWVRFVERRPLATIGLVGSHPIRTFLGGLAVGVATSFAVVAAIWMAGGYTASGYFEALGSPKALLGIAVVLPCFALQSSVEESVMRGWLLSGIARKLNVLMGVLLSSATFTLLHFDAKQPWLTLTTCFLFSVFACLWAMRAGNIWAVMGWHAGWNWLLAVGFGLRVTGINVGLPALLVKMNPVGSAVVTGGAEGPEGSIWCCVVLAACTTFMLWRSRRSSPETLAAPEAIQDLS